MTFDDAFRSARARSSDEDNRQLQREYQRDVLLRQEIDELADSLRSASGHLARAQVPTAPVFRWSGSGRFLAKTADYCFGVWNFAGRLQLDSSGNIYAMKAVSKYESQLPERLRKRYESVGAQGFYYDYLPPIDLRGSNVSYTYHDYQQRIKINDIGLVSQIEVGSSGKILYHETGRRSYRPPIPIVVADWASDLIDGQR